MQTEYIEVSVDKPVFVSAFSVLQRRGSALVRILGKARDDAEYTELWSGPSDSSNQHDPAMRAKDIEVIRHTEPMIDFRLEFFDASRDGNNLIDLNGVKVIGSIRPPIEGQNIVSMTLNHLLHLT
jgi:hypothetical protein